MVVTPTIHEAKKFMEMVRILNLTKCCCPMQFLIAQGSQASGVAKTSGSKYDHHCTYI